MGKDSVEKGRAFEDTVELWISSKGFAYEKRPRVKTAFGFTTEIDFIVYDKRGKFIVEVKNLDKPVDRDVVLKAWNNAIAVGAHKVLVISASGFTEAAVNVARRLGIVELHTLDEIVYEVEELTKPSAPFLEPSITAWSAMKWAEDVLARRRFLLFKSERGESVESLYIPLYYIKTSISVEKNKYRDVAMLASGLTGLPIAYDRSSRRLAEVLDALIDLPRDVVEVYRIYAGRTVRRQEIIYNYGRSMWVKMMRHLTPRGLIRRVSERPVVVSLISVYPDIDQLEQAVNTLENVKTLKEPLEEFEVREPIYSPGSTRLFIETTLKAEVRTIDMIYAPVYRVELVDNNGNYRHVTLVGWTGETVVYESKYLV